MTTSRHGLDSVHRDRQTPDYSEKTVLPIRIHSSLTNSRLYGQIRHITMLIFCKNRSNLHYKQRCFFCTIYYSPQYEQIFGTHVIKMQKLRKCCGAGSQQHNVSVQFMCQQCVPLRWFVDRKRVGGLGSSPNISDVLPWTLRASAWIDAAIRAGSLVTASVSCVQPHTTLLTTGRHVHMLLGRQMVKHALDTNGHWAHGAWWWWPHCPEYIILSDFIQTLKYLIRRAKQAWIYWHQSKTG